VRCEGLEELLVQVRGEDGQLVSREPGRFHVAGSHDDLDEGPQHPRSRDGILSLAQRPADRGVSDVDPPLSQAQLRETRLRLAACFVGGAIGTLGLRELAAKAVELTA
jgi:hypothetical protein